MKMAWMLLATLLCGCAGPAWIDHERSSSGVVEGTVIGKAHGIIYIRYKDDGNIGTWEPNPLVYAMIPVGHTTHVHWRVDDPIVEPGSQPIGYGVPVKLGPICTQPTNTLPVGPGINESMPSKQLTEPVRLETLAP